jgi:ribosomal-protein-alanine N-acetyltransferase
LGKGHCNSSCSSTYVLEHGSVGLDTVFAMPFAHNVASCPVLGKAGYDREGLLRKSAIKDGHVLDQVLYDYVG